MGIEGIDEIEKRQAFPAQDLQLGILPHIGCGENRRRDAGKILGKLFILQQLRTRHSHHFYADAENADIVYVAPVYAAGEEPIDGSDSEALAEGLKQRGHGAVSTVKGPEDLARQLRDVAARGDMVICLGAGDITKWAAGLADGIRQARLAK